MIRAWLNIGVILLPIVLLNSCASTSSNSSEPTAGFAQAENDQVIISGASPQAVILDGNYYVRWNFEIRPKQNATFSSIRIEDVTDPTAVLLVNDVAPQLDGGQWNETAGLMPPSATGARWLSEPGDSVRTFRFTFTGLDGRSDALEQNVRYSQDTKNQLRAQLKI